MRFLRILAFAVAPFVLATTLAAQSLEVQLQRAVQREIATGDSKAAIAEYRRIADRAARSDRVVAARALLRLAEAHQKMGDAEADKVYRQIVERYSDQAAIVASARARLSTARPTTSPAGVARRRVWTDSDVQRITGWGRISPDGRFFAFAANTWNDLVVREVATGTERILVHDISGEISNPIWSRDGKRIAFQFGRHDVSDVRVVNFDGSGVRTMMSTPRDLEFFAIEDWSPDGTRLLVQASPNDDDNFRLFWFNVNDGRRTTLFEGAYSGRFAASISPDGRFVAFGGVGVSSPDRATRKSGQHIRVTSSDGTRNVILTANTGDLFPVGWAPDNSAVVVVSLRSAKMGLWALPLDNGAPSGEARVLERDLCNCGEIMSNPGTAQTNLLPLGSTSRGDFYYRMQQFVSDIYTASLDPHTGRATSASVPLTVSRSGYNVWPKWSPDGNRILYYWSSTSQREFSVVTVATAAERRLNGVSLDGGGFCWSGPDVILFRRVRGERAELRRYDLRTQEDALVFDEPIQSFVGVNCSADAQIIVTRNNPITALTVRNMRTNERTTVTLPRGIRSGFLPVSPDGNNVAFLGTTTDGTAVGLFVLPLNGEPAREVARVNAPAEFLTGVGYGWSPDSQYVYYSKRPLAGAEYELFRRRIAGGAEEAVGIKGRDLRDINLSPDGTRIAFSIGSLNRPEIWAVENMFSRSK